MTRWTYRVMDTRTGRMIRDHLPMSNVRFTDTLDNGGSFTGDYEVGTPGMPDMPRDCIARLMVWPCRDGVPQGAFIITGVDDDMVSPTVSLNGSRFDSILDKRELYHDLNFTDIDQLQIARDLCRYGVGINTVHTPTVVSDPLGTHKGLSWFRIGGAVSGVLRTIVVSTETTGDEGYSGTRGLFIGDMLRDLADASPQPGEGVKVGFEIRADYGWDASDGGYWARVTFGWPTIGLTQTERKIVFEYASTDASRGAVASCTYSADWDQFATRFRVVGKERDNKRPTGVAVNTALHTYGYPLLDRNITSGAVTESARLGDRAATALFRQSKIRSGWRLTLNPDAQPEWGTYRIGDHVTLRVRRGNTKLPDQILRITGWDIEVDPSGESEIISPHLMEP